MTDCLFCKIVKREIPASLVYEDSRLVAFTDINPQAPTHILVIPKRHIASLNELEEDDEQLIGEMVRRAAAIAKERGISAGGFRTVFNTNRDAGPDCVPHPSASARRAQHGVAARLRRALRDDVRRARAVRLARLPVCGIVDPDVVPLNHRDRPPVQRGERALAFESLAKYRLFPVVEQ